jgi:uncharacterized protein with GYD domain
MWQTSILYILIATIACQEAKQQPQEITTARVLSEQTSSEEPPGTAKDSAMTFYLTRFSYTADTWARLVKNPEDRREAARRYIESVGGKLHGFWYAFGEYDGYCLWEAPNNVSMAAVGLAIYGGGALSKFETTVLLTVDQTLAALRQVQSIGYRPPGGK